MASTAKAYGLPFDYVLYELSYANMTLYSAVLPSYHSPKDKERRKGQRDDGVRVKADDPKNTGKVMEMLKKMR